MGHLQPRHERFQFHAPVEIRWTSEIGEASCTSGFSLDVSVYGLCIDIPVSIPIDTRLAVSIGGVWISGAANVRYAVEYGARFKVGIEFQRMLLSQNIPELDDVFLRSIRLKNHDSDRSRTTIPPRFSQKCPRWANRKLVANLWTVANRFHKARKCKGAAAIVSKHVNEGLAMQT